MNARLIATALPLLLFSPLLGVDGGLAFAPEDGKTVVKTFVDETSFTLDDMTQIVGGVDVEQEVPALSGANLRKTVVTDEYTKVADGRPQKLLRTFDTVEGDSEFEIDVEGMTEGYEFSVESELVDQIVLFTLDNVGEKYAATDPEGETKPEFEGLSEDMDLRGFLPDKKVEKLGTWEIEPQALIDAFRSGGDKLVAPDSTPDGEYVMVTATQVMSASLLSLTELGSATGEVTATWEETKEEDGATLAVIALEAEITALGDGTERVEFLLDEIGADAGEENLSVELELTMTGSGQLVWNISEGRFESFVLESEIAMEIAFAWDQDFGGQDVEIEIEASLSGESRFEASAKAE